MGRPTLTAPNAERRRPARGISWEAAMDFCWWAGMHLPLEREWERTARGPQGRRFSWGNDWNPLALVWSGYNRALAAMDDPPSDAKPIGSSHDVPHPAEVDTFAAYATPEGVRHLHGNVSEWVIDLPVKYPGSKSTFLFGGIALGARGGSYCDPAEVMLAADRAWGESLR